MNELEYSLHRPLRFDNAKQDCLAARTQAAEAPSMLNLKFLIASGAAAAGTWKLWSDPRLSNIVLDVVLAMLASWLIFLLVFFLTALQMRRFAARTPVEPGDSRRLGARGSS